MSEYKNVPTWEVEYWETILDENDPETQKLAQEHLDKMYKEPSEAKTHLNTGTATK